MEQAFYVVNLDKKQYLHPHVFGDGYRLVELKYCLAALSIMLANCNSAYGLQDLPLFGTWCGDRIAVVGEYSDLGSRIGLEEGDEGYDGWEEVGAELAEAMYAEGLCGRSLRCTLQC